MRRRTRARRGGATGTIRAQLINIPARLARSARRLRMHLPQHWPWEQAWSQLLQATWHHPDRPDPTTRRQAQPEPKWKSRADRPSRHAHTRGQDQNAEPDKIKRRAVHPG
jgi:hypothetical protein